MNRPESVFRPALVTESQVDEKLLFDHSRDLAQEAKARVCTHMLLSEKFIFKPKPKASLAGEGSGDAVQHRDAMRDANRTRSHKNVTPNSRKVPK